MSSKESKLPEKKPQLSSKYDAMDPKDKADESIGNEEPELPPDNTETEKPPLETEEKEKKAKKKKKKNKSKDE